MSFSVVSVFVAAPYICFPGKSKNCTVTAVTGWKPSLLPGTGIMEADDRQVTTVFTVQPSFHHRHSTNRVSWSVTIVGERRGEVWLPTIVTLHDTRFAECRWWNDGSTVNCRHLTVVGLHDTGPWFCYGFFKAARITKLGGPRQWVQIGLTLNVLYRTIPHKLYRHEVKDVYGLQSFVWKRSEGSDSLLFFSVCNWKYF